MPRKMEAPVLSVTMLIVIIVEITKQGNIKKELKNIQLIVLINIF